MEVTCAPPKWKFIKQHPTNREERARRCRAAVLDFSTEQISKRVDCDDPQSLTNALGAVSPNSQGVKTRVIIVEDLSRDVVEILGAHYDIDPHFFMSHLYDYLFHNPRDPWVELPELDVVARERPHFMVQYLRARYFQDDAAFKEAERQTGEFNVLRRLDSDRSSQRLSNSLLDKEGARVTLTRAKASVWTRPTESQDNPLIGKCL